MDAGFMERAAATLRERRITSRGFTEMIRAITGLPTSADVHNLMQQRSRSTAEAVPRSSPGGLAIDGIYGDRESAVAQQRNGDDLVTLPLLPNTPSRAASSLSSIAHIQQIHSNSSEPILLLDDARRILWLNRAYERALKDSIGRHAAVGPFIDPLGIPTQLGRFSLQLDGCSSGTTTSVTLWGFLKKIVAVGAASGSFSGFPVKNGSFLDGFSLKDGLHTTPTTGVAQQQLQDCCEAGRNSGGVIVPQPIRLVGSTVLLESITDVQQEPALPVLPESLEALKKQLEEGTWPAFISDWGSNLVRWVNTTYKQMVGQPECPWLASAVSSSKLGDGGGASAMPRLMGEILLTCSVEVPPSAPAFSGRANIQWTKNSGERSCITVPCDVSRLDGISCCNGKVMLLWKFHVHASLRLTAGI